MTVEDKAQNILRLGLHGESSSFEVIDPENQVTAHAIPQALLKVSGDEQSGPAGDGLPIPFVVSVLDQKKEWVSRSSGGLRGHRRRRTPLGGSDGHGLDRPGGNYADLGERSPAPTRWRLL